MNPRIIGFPTEGIAYNDSLYKEFNSQGIEVVNGVWAGRWLINNIRATDVIHIHWPSFFYISQGSTATILKSFFRFVILISIVRVRTNAIWWTAHNLYPHVRCRLPLIDNIARKIVIEFSKSVFVHGREAEEILISEFPKAGKKTLVIPHGNWIDHYPASGSQHHARSKLNLPASAFIYLLFGQCKPYKNIEGLIDAFREIANHDDILLIAGGFSDPNYLELILRLAAQDSRIRVDQGFIPDEKVSDYLMACSCLCMPYLEILTSGTTMLALSYGRPVLSINRGFLRDTVTEVCGVLVEPGDRDSLLAGLRSIRSKRWIEGEILLVAKKFTFYDAVKRSLSSLDVA